MTMQMQQTTQQEADFDVYGTAGSILTIVPNNAGASDWLNANTQTEPWQWQGPALIVDRRFAYAIIEEARNEGFTIH